MEKAKKVKKNISILNMGVTLILFALIPMVVSVLSLSNMFTSNMTSELKKSTNNAMISLIKQTGNSFDYTMDENESVMMNFIQAPVVMKLLKDPDNAALAEEAENYTVNFYNSLNGWEGIYIADWNSKVLTHPAPPVVGKVMREGDRLTALQNDMKNAGNVLNYGIISSPASGQLIISMYAPVYDENKAPVGYVGGGTFVNAAAAHFSDVSSLGISSAYIYFVDPTGTILYHPDETLIGTPAENEAVAQLTGEIASGKHPDPGCIEYELDGVKKYDAYYVGKNNAYIAILSADEADVLANTVAVSEETRSISLKLVLFFAALTIAISFSISIPLKKVAKAITQLSTGDVTVECNPISHIKETNSVINAFHALKAALGSSMSNVADSANRLNTAILDVDNMTSKNASSISQINHAIDEVAKTSQSVAVSAQTMAGKATELEQDVDVLNSNVSALFDTSRAIKEANDDATECMRAMSLGATESVQAVQDISAKISETNEAIDQIGVAVQAIESIASKTNLLSLNASIEAARAGAAGRGFSVVAEEIRTLADSSAESAREIREIIGNVVKRSNETVEISNKVYEIISKEQADIEATTQKFQVLSGSIEASLSGIDSIQQMTGRLEDIKSNLMSATSSLGAISEELGASSEEVAASCQNVSSAINDTKASARDMRGINDNMSSAIGFFKLS